MRYRRAFQSHIRYRHQRPQGNSIMTDQMPTGPDPYAYSPPPLPPPSRPPHHRAWLAVAIGAILVVGGAVGALTATGAFNHGSTTAAQPGPAVSEQASASELDTFPLSATPSSTAPPAPTDFTVSLTITAKDCFGSAGCNVTYRPDLTWNGIDPMDTTQNYEIVYEVLGGQDGSQVESITTDGEKFSITEQVVQTASSATKLTAKVTQVLPD
jgi:hypothetical protein